MKTLAPMPLRLSLALLAVLAASAASAQSIPLQRPLPLLRPNGTPPGAPIAPGEKAIAPELPHASGPVMPPPPSSPTSSNRPNSPGTAGPPPSSRTRGKTQPTCEEVRARGRRPIPTATGANASDAGGR